MRSGSFTRSVWVRARAGSVTSAGWTPGAGKGFGVGTRDSMVGTRDSGLGTRCLVVLVGATLGRPGRRIARHESRVPSPELRVTSPDMRFADVILTALAQIF